MRAGLGLVYSLAVKLRHRGHPDFDDVVSDGSLALVRADRDFDESHGLPFLSYAVPRIRWAMIDGIRARERARETERRWIRSHPGAGVADPVDFEVVPGIAFEELLDLLDDRLRRVALASLTLGDQVALARELGLSEGRISQLKTRVRETFVEDGRAPPGPGGTIDRPGGTRGESYPSGSSSSRSTT